MSGGQAVVVPVQNSSVSQTPAAARQMVPAVPAGWVAASVSPSPTARVETLVSSVHGLSTGFLLSAGQAALVPVQNSGRSHSPPAARHEVVFGRNRSGGQLLPTPSQNSSVSQTPAE